MTIIIAPVRLQPYTVCEGLIPVLLLQH